MNPDVWKTDSTSLSVIWVQKIKRSEIAHLIKKNKTPRTSRDTGAWKSGGDWWYCTAQRGGKEMDIAEKKTQEFIIKCCAQEHEYNYNFNVNDALYTNQT